MSKLEENLKTTINSEIKSLKLKSAYDYLNQISFTVDGSPNKTVELLSSDAVCLTGNSSMTNLMLTKIAVHCLLPKKYGGLRSSKVFILDAGNSSDVYQFIDFMKQYGMNVKKNLRRILISRVFTVYQLCHFLKYELVKTIHDYRINIVVIPDILEMFLQEEIMDIDEVKFLITEIINVIKVIINNGKVILVTSLCFDDKLLPATIVDLGNRLVKCFNMCIAIDRNKTNDKFKMIVQQKQSADYVAIKKYASLTTQDVLAVNSRKMRDNG